jgi:hypothetical protein
MSLLKPVHSCFGGKDLLSIIIAILSCYFLFRSVYRVSDQFDSEAVSRFILVQYLWYVRFGSEADGRID